MDLQTSHLAEAALVAPASWESPVRAQQNFYETTLPEITQQSCQLSPAELRRLKWQLLALGVRVHKRAKNHIERVAKWPQQVRSGASNGLELVLPGGIWANAPFAYQAGTASQHVPPPQLRLSDNESEFTLHDFATNYTVPVAVVPRPHYYDKQLGDGRAMNWVGQMCADRIGFGLSTNCYFWRSDRRCAFCSIGVNHREERRDKTLEEILTVLRAAQQDPILPARHLLISGGTPATDDWGVNKFCGMAEAIRSHTEFDTQRMYLMTVPPKNQTELQRLHDAGYQDIALNIEIWNTKKAQQLIPGKHREIGRGRYLEALEQAVAIWKETHAVRSLLVVGLESLDDTLAGVEAISATGADPILSVFRSAKGSRLESEQHADPEWLDTLYIEASKLTKKFQVDLGPRCACCRTNVLSI